MEWEAAIKCSYHPSTGHRYSLRLKSPETRSEFSVPLYSGAYNHIMTEFLKGADWNQWERAYSDVGSLHSLGVIELDEYDLSPLTRFRVN